MQYFSPSFLHLCPIFNLPNLFHKLTLSFFKGKKAIWIHMKTYLLGSKLMTIQSCWLKSRKSSFCPMVELVYKSPCFKSPERHVIHHSETLIGWFLTFEHDPMGNLPLWETLKNNKNPEMTWTFLAKRCWQSCLRSNSLVVKALDSKSRSPRFKIAGWL